MSEATFGYPEEENRVRTLMCEKLMENNSEEHQKVECYAVTDVTNVTNVTNKEESNESNESNNNNSVTLRFSQDFLNRFSENQKLKFYYLQYGALTDKELSQLFFDDEEKAGNVRVMRSRLDVVKVTNDRPAKYDLTENARLEARKEWEKYQDEQDELKLKNRDEVILEQSIREWKEFLTLPLPPPNNGKTLLEKAEEERLTRETYDVFSFDYSELAKTHPFLALELEKNLDEQLTCLRQILQNEYEFPKVDVAITGFRDNKKIARIRVADFGKMINLHGEVIGKGELRDRATSIRFECRLCGEQRVVVIPLGEEKFRVPRICKCGGKLSFREIRKEIATIQNLTIQEVPELLNPDESPARLACLVMGGLAEKYTERLTYGSRLTLTGCYIHRKEGQNAEFERLFHVVGVDKLDEELHRVPPTPEVIAEVNRIRESDDPLLEVSKLVYERVIDRDAPKLFLTAQLFGDFHVLLLGDPGTGKSELAKCSTEATARSLYIQSTNASRAGLTASATKDKHTERFVIENNAVARLHPHGLAYIDELDKAKEDVQASLLGIMQDKKITIHKTNVQQEVPADIRVVACANTKNDRFVEGTPLRYQVEMLDPLFDRFTFKLLFSGGLNRYEDFKPFFTKRHEKASGLSRHKRLVLRELINSGREITPRIDDGDVHTRLNDLMKRIKDFPDVYGNSLRIADGLFFLLEALCRLTREERPREYHFDKLEFLLRELQSNHIAERGEFVRSNY